MSTLQSDAPPGEAPANIEINRVLIIDDDEDYRKLLAMKLGRSFPHIIINEIDPLNEPMPDKEFCWDDIDFIILDFNLGIEYTGLDWFRKFRSEDLPATILLTARGSEELAVTAMKLGIDDYIVKEHFDNKRLTESILECVREKRREKDKRLTLSRQSVVFNKPNFIHKLRLIISEKDTNHHLFMFNPVAYQEIGEERGIHFQDAYVRHIADVIYEYLAPKNITFNIFIYREEYVAVLIEASSYQHYVNGICSRLKKKTFGVGIKDYSCAVSAGVISPKNIEASELNRSDFEILSIAMVLCNTAENDGGNAICSYGEVDIKEATSPGETPLAHQNLGSFDLEAAIGEGRVSANYQPWVCIRTDDESNLKGIYDIRIGFIDNRGNVIAQNVLVKLLDNAYSRRIVDRWVLRHAISQLNSISRKESENAQLKLAVKITLSSFADPAFVDWLRDLLADAQISGDGLMLEFDANQLARNPQHFRALLGQVGADFGIKTVLSGVTEIDKYYRAHAIQPFDFVKLNVSKLTYAQPRDPLHSLVDKIRRDGAKIVAVNVADAEMLALASEFDVDYMHGYLIGRPGSDIIEDSEGDLYCVM